MRSRSRRAAPNPQVGRGVSRQVARARSPTASTGSELRPGAPGCDARSWHPPGRKEHLGDGERCFPTSRSRRRQPARPLRFAADRRDAHDRRRPVQLAVEALARAVRGRAVPGQGPSSTSPRPPRPRPSAPWRRFAISSPRAGSTSSLGPFSRSCAKAGSARTLGSPVHVAEVGEVPPHGQNEHDTRASPGAPLREPIGGCRDRGGDPGDPHRSEILPVSYEAPTLAP
jgi:hypothetical protein